MNHYPKHVGDYIRDTVGLTMTEDGAYTRLLDQYYAREAPLPSDKATIYRMARATSKQERAAVDSVLNQFFTATPDGWRQKRADLELQAQCERSASARQSAKLRWEKEHANAMRTHMQTQCEGNAESMLTSSQKPVTINQEVKSKSTRKRATPLPDPFPISERVTAWAAGGNFGPLEKHHEAFVGKARAKGYTYVDWDEAFMNCIREDWGKVRATGPTNGKHDARAKVGGEIWKGTNDERPAERVIDGEAKRVA